jgi:hypothetical protein
MTIAFSIVLILIGLNLWFLFKQKKNKDWHSFVFYANRKLENEKNKLEEDIEQLKLFMQNGLVRLTYIHALPHIVVYSKNSTKVEVKIYNMETKSFSYCQGSIIEQGNTIIELEETHADSQHHEAVLRDTLLGDGISFNQLSQY